MGCGSSKSAVAVVEESKVPLDKEMKEETPKAPKKTTSLEHFQVKSSRSSLKSETKISRLPSASSSISSIIELNNNNNSTVNKEFRKSQKSLQELSKKPSTANSSKSGDSGVFDENERISSGKSRKASLSSVSAKPPSGKKSSARQRLLRIDNQSLENHQKQLENDKNEKNISNGDISMVSRPKSRFGNVAFDLLIDTPETGNMKKRPDLLPALEQRKKKKSKKIKTKEEIEKKMQQVEERRKIQEMEKQMKAKQFQHLAVHTTVEPFSPENEDEDQQQEIKEMTPAT